MDMVLIRFTATAVAPLQTVSPRTVEDILWANADPADQIEHFRVHALPEPGAIDLAVFLLPAETPSASTVLRVCRAAIDKSPQLLGWTAALLSG